MCVSISASSCSLLTAFVPHNRHHQSQQLLLPVPNFSSNSKNRVSLVLCHLQQQQREKSSSLSTSPNSNFSPNPVKQVAVTENKKRHWKVGEYPPPPPPSPSPPPPQNNRYRNEKPPQSDTSISRNNRYGNGKSQSNTSSSSNNGYRNGKLDSNSGYRNGKLDSNNGYRNGKLDSNSGYRNGKSQSNTNYSGGRNRNNSSRNYSSSPSRSPVGGLTFNNNKIKNIKMKMDRRSTAKAWASTVTESLSDLILKKQWHNALEVFEMLKQQPFYQPKEGTYMKLLVLLGRCGQPKHAQLLFDTMILEGIDPTPQLYTALLSAYCRSNLIDPSFSILSQMKSLPLCQPDVYTYSILIKACVDACQFDLVQKLYSEMHERSIAPNTVTQNTVLSGYGKAGEYDRMETVLSGMLESTSSRPDVWTMNTIIGLFGNKGEIEMMEKWYEKFRNFGIEPETRTFNILIGAYGKKKMYDKMSSVMEYMRKLSFPWTTSTYNNVIEAFSDVGDAKNMDHTFDQMRSEGIKADTKTFCCLIRGYANAGIFHKVISCAQLAGEMEIPENTSFYNAIIFACAKAEDLVEMERVFRRMREKECMPDENTYDVMMDVYRRQGMSDKVYDLEQEKEKIMMINNQNSSSQVEEDSDLEEI